MLLGIDTSTIGKRSTGTNIYVQCLLDQIHKFPINVKEFTYSDDEFSWGKFPLKNIGGFFRGGLRRHFYRTFQLPGDMNSAGVDAALFPNYFMPSNFTKPAAVVIHDLSFVTHPHFYSKIFVKYYNYLLKQTLNKNPLILAVSEFTKSQISKYLNIKKEHIYLLQGYSRFNGKHNGYNPKIEKNPYFLFVGHLEPRKNLDFLIGNFLEWKHNRNIPYKLKITGDIWIKSKVIKNLLNEYFENNDVEFTGYVSEEKLAELYDNASAFVHTSLVEGFGFPVLEAMNKRIPILCSNNSATAEISKGYSVQIDPYSNISLINGFDKLDNLIHTHPRWQYNIDYSPELMKAQLGRIITELESKTKKTFPVKEINEMSTEEALEKTLLYANLFNTGVRKEKLHKFLFDKKSDLNDLENALENLSIQKKIFYKDTRVYLSEGDKFFYENKSNNFNKNKIDRHLKFLNNIPFISNVAYSGGTAHYGIENHDDIDLFIITKPYTVYLVYLFIHIYSLMTKSRNYFCANYLIDEKDILIDSQYDFYTAFQIISLVPVRNKERLNYFFHVNRWVKDFFPNFCVPGEFEKPNSKIFITFKPINKLFFIFYRRLYKNSLKMASNHSLN